MLYIMKKCLLQLRKYLLSVLVFSCGMCLLFPVSCCIYVAFERKKRKNKEFFQKNKKNKQNQTKKHDKHEK